MPDPNDVYIRLSQTALKQIGLYTGKIDGMWGPKSYDSLLTIIEKAGYKLKPVNTIIDRIGLTQEIIDKCKEMKLRREHCAYALATGFWESGHTMEPVKEAYYLQPKYKWSDARMEKWRKDNLRYYPWYGRGLVQITWERNYLKASEELGKDFIARPDDVMIPENSIEIMLRGMVEGWFTTKKLSDYIHGTTVDFVNARRIINGTDKAGAIALIASEYNRNLQAEGYTIN